MPFGPERVEDHRVSAENHGGDEVLLAHRSLDHESLGAQALFTIGHQFDRPAVVDGQNDCQSVQRPAYLDVARGSRRTQHDQSDQDIAQRLAKAMLSTVMSREAPCDQHHGAEAEPQRPMTREAKIAFSGDVEAHKGSENERAEGGGEAEPERRASPEPGVSHEPNRRSGAGARSTYHMQPSRHGRSGPSRCIGRGNFARRGLRVK